MTGSGPAVAETHSAVVVFQGDYAFKIKKPVDLGFLDFSTLELREAACRREVELNRRLAPDVYEGVATIQGPHGELLEHVVVMRRMPDDRRLSTLAVAGTDLGGDIESIARVVAAFHSRSARSAEADGLASVTATRARWNANSEALMSDGGLVFAGGIVARVHALACRYLDGRRRLFDARILDGRAVDGHGDLLADDIFLLPDGPRILDCLDFDEHLRTGDGLSDVAFLAMDLERLGRPDLAVRLTTSYSEHNGDVWPASLLHHHIAYRAQVRAKVMGVRAGQGDRSSAEAAQRLLELALHHLELGRVRLVLVGGPPGTGKSTLASHLATDLGAVVLTSDVTRKELGGGSGRYDQATTAATYETILRRAEAALSMGSSVVLDATWADPDHRRRARLLAERTASDLVELSCWAPADACDQRIRARGVDPNASDATPSVAAAVRGRFAPWPEAHVVDTTDSPAISFEVARAALHVRAGLSSR